MKLHTLFLVLLLPWGAHAGPLAREHVAADAKWLVHLDLDVFRGTQLGEQAIHQFLDPQITKVTQVLKEQFDIDFDWKQVHGVTVYGLDFKKPEKMDGVVLIQTELDVAQALETVLDRLTAQDPNAAPFQRLQQQPFPMYALKNGKEGVVGAPVAKGLFALARKREAIEQARRVCTGQADSLTAAKRTAPPVTQSAGFLTVSVMDAALAGAGLPQQMRVLKDAQGAQVVAGEKADKIFLSAALEAKDNAVATQIQQALQGVVALAMLADLPDKDLKLVAESVKVSGRDNTVTIDLQVPVDLVTQKMVRKEKKRRG